jgi:hypothetical protein
MFARKELFADAADFIDESRNGFLVRQRIAVRYVSTTLRQHIFTISLGTQCCRGPAPDPPGFFQA